MRMAWLTSACSKSEAWVRDGEAELEGEGTLFDVRVEVGSPDGPGSSGDRTRESVLLEIIIASRRVSAKASSSADSSWPG